MKHRNEDEVLRLAFGDLAGEEARRARELIERDADARALFDEYSGIAEGLRKLPVAEHQLSTERLRQAILDRGLKRSRVAAAWRWIWAPAAVAATAYVATVILRPGATSTVMDSIDRPVPASTSSAAGVEAPKIELPSGTDTASEALSRPLVARSEPEIRPAPAPTSIRAESAPTRVAVRSEGSPSRGGSASSPALPEDLSREIMSTVAAAAPSPSSPEPGVPLVIIGADTDSQTGLNRATEVSTSRNVVVGG